jgi:catechol 2,3-dioxygenase-like lactoylglutathione lyase family enzyme
LEYALEKDDQLKRIHEDDRIDDKTVLLTGRIGTGQLTVTSFAVPEKSLGYWKDRLTKHETSVQEATSEFDEIVLFFTDPDGLQLELIATPNANPDRAWNRDFARHLT